MDLGRDGVYPSYTQTGDLAWSFVADYLIKDADNADAEIQLQLAVADSRSNGHLGRLDLDGQT